MPTQSFSQEILDASRIATLLSDPARLDLLRILSEGHQFQIDTLIDKSPLKTEQVVAHLQTLVQGGLANALVCNGQECFEINRSNLFSAQVFLGSLLDEWNNPPA